MHPTGLVAAQVVGSVAMSSAFWPRLCGKSAQRVMLTVRRARAEFLFSAGTLTWRNFSPHGVSSGAGSGPRQGSRLTPQQVVVGRASSARGPTRLTPVAPDALELRGVRGMARRAGVLVRRTYAAAARR